MTVTGIPFSPTTASVSRASASQGDAHIRDAATQLEGVFLQQLFAMLRKTLPGGSMFGAPGSSGEMYMQMMDQAMGEQLARDGGVGLAAQLSASLGASEATPAARTAGSMPLGPRSLELKPRPAPPAAAGASTAAAGRPLWGGTGALQQVAKQLLHDPTRWSREGVLTPNELASDVQGELAGGVARFNVRDAMGYQGYTKCNLFALEMARRAGFAVPVIGREHGYGFPSAGAVALDAADDGSLQGEWGKVVTGASASDLDRAIVEGGRAFLLAGATDGSTPGHMAVIERVHAVEYDNLGKIQKIAFDGWEARPGGAEHLVQRAWHRTGNPGGPGVRSGFQDIEIIELVRPGAGGRPEVLISDPKRASFRDAIASSHAGERPKQRMEAKR